MTDTDAPHKKVRDSDPLTSRDAAGKQTTSRSSTLRDHLLRLLKLYGPQTDDGLAQLYAEVRDNAPSLYPPVSPSGLRSRRAELVTDGLVEKSGEKRMSALGSPSIVWRAAA